jgi:hypothetical protein
MYSEHRLVILPAAMLPAPSTTRPSAGIAIVLTGATVQHSRKREDV